MYVPPLEYTRVEDHGISDVRTRLPEKVMTDDDSNEEFLTATVFEESVMQSRSLRKFTTVSPSNKNARI